MSPPCLTKHPVPSSGSSPRRHRASLRPPQCPLRSSTASFAAFLGFCGTWDTAARPSPAALCACFSPPPPLRGTGVPRRRVSRRWSRRSVSCSQWCRRPERTELRVRGPSSAFPLRRVPQSLIGSVPWIDRLSWTHAGVSPFLTPVPLPGAAHGACSAPPPPAALADHTPRSRPLLPLARLHGRHCPARPRGRGVLPSMPGTAQARLRGHAASGAGLIGLLGCWGG